MIRSLFRKTLVTLSVVIFVLYALQFSVLAVEDNEYVSLDTEAVTLFLGDQASEEDKYYQFEATIVGMYYSPLLWSLSDYTYATVDQNGLVKLKENVPKESVEVIVTLTVRTVLLNKSDTALIFIEMEPPQSAPRLPMTKAMFAEIYKEPTFDSHVVPLSKAGIYSMPNLLRVYKEVFLID